MSLTPPTSIFGSFTFFSKATDQESASVNKGQWGLNVMTAKWQKEAISPKNDIFGPSLLIARPREGHLQQVLLN